MKKMKDYQYHYGIKARMYPSLAQEQNSFVYGSAAHFSYNKVKGVKDEIYNLKKTTVYIKPIADRIDYLQRSISSAREMKNAFPFLQEVPSHVIENAKRNYQKAWDNYKRGNAKIPAFHKKSNSFSFSVNPSYPASATSMNDSNGCYIIDERHVQIEGLGVVKVRFSKKLIKRLLARTAETRLGTFTVTKDATDKYYLSIQLASDEPFVENYPKTERKAGVDLNIENFLTDSDGHVINNPKFLKQSEKHLKQEQRKLSKKAARAKKEGRKLSESKNYQKQRKKVAAIHNHIANQRKDFLHKTAAYELKSHDEVYAENLNVKSMIKDHSYAKEIGDAGWRLFLSIMKEKAALRGRIFKTVNPKDTTQTCHCCGYVLAGDERIDTTVRVWDCPNCGEHHLRDYNAAINTLKRGEGAH